MLGGMLLHELDKRVDIRLWMRGVRHMASAGKCEDLRLRKRRSEPVNHGREGGWALVAQRCVLQNHSKSSFKVFPNFPERICPARHFLDVAPLQAVSLTSL